MSDLHGLGGHIRRHRGTSDDILMLKLGGKKVGRFDLNLPPSDENFDCVELGPSWAQSFTWTQIWTHCRVKKKGN